MKSRTPSPLLLHNFLRHTHLLLAYVIAGAIAILIGVHFHIPSVAATTTNVHFNAINSSTKVPLSEKSSSSSTTLSASATYTTSTISFTSPLSSAFTAAFAATSSLSTAYFPPSEATWPDKNTLRMSSHQPQQQQPQQQYITGTSPSSSSSSPSTSSSSLSSSTKTIDSQQAPAQGSLAAIAGGSGSGSVNAALPSSSSLVSLTPSYKSTSKLPLSDYGFTKNLWSNTGSSGNGNAIRPTIPTAPITSGGNSGVRIFRNKHHHEHHWGPFFEEPLNSSSSGDNLVSTAHLFTEAVLNCRVGMLKDKTVMWVRRSADKVSLLTVGNVTYSGDPRIRVKFQYPNNWRLLINPTQKEDAGVYMCQVSTHPPKVFTTNLTVLESPLRLIDEQEREVADRYYKSGSTIDLQCQISRSFLLKEHYSIMKSIGGPANSEPLMALAKGNALKDAQVAGGGYGLGTNDIEAGNKSRNFEKQFIKYIFWAKDDAALPEGASMRTSTTAKWLISRISIADAKLTDSGNYSCSIGKLFTVIVQVQVLTGELPAAVQHNSVASTLRPGGCYLNATRVINCIALLIVWAHISCDTRNWP